MSQPQEYGPMRRFAPTMNGFMKGEEVLRAGMNELSVEELETLQAQLEDPKSVITQKAQAYGERGVQRYKDAIADTLARKKTKRS